MSRTRRHIRAIGALTLSVAFAHLPRALRSQTEDDADAPDTVIFDEVVVTATKRQEATWSIPVSVTILDGEEVERQQAKTLEDLQGQVPNLFLASSSKSHTPFIFIRGLGLNDFNQIAQGSVGIYLDEVYQNSTAVQLSQLFDLERIEVLRGPQGTLYGRNTTGGAINLVTRKPTGENRFTVRASFGSDNLRELALAGGTAISDRVSTRLAGVVHRRDGIMTHSSSGEKISETDDWAARALLGWRAGERQDWLLSVSASAVDEDAPNWESSPLNAARWDVGTPWEVEVTDPGVEQVDALRVTLTGNVELSGSTLTSVTGYVASERFSIGDLDLQAADVVTDTRRSDAEQWSQELRWTSTGGGRFDWLAGLYFFQEDLAAATDLAANGLLGFTFLSENDFFQDDRSAAAFGHGSYQLTERLSLTAGLRFTWEEKAFRNAQQGFFGAPLEQGQDTETWTEPTATIGLRQFVGENLMWYGKWSRGFRSGGFNAGGAVGDPPFSPELVDGLEAGLKRRWATGRLFVTAFGSEYRDMQVLARVERGGITRQILTNAAKAEIYGIESELTFQPIDRISLTAGFAWLETRFAEFVDVDGIDRRGNRLAGSPELSFNGTAQYVIGLGHQRGELSVGFDWSFTDEVYFDFANTERLAQEGYWWMGARFGFESPGRKLGVAIWGRNITGEAYSTFALPIPALGIDLIRLGTPETYGLSITWRR